MCFAGLQPARAVALCAVALRAVADGAVALLPDAQAQLLRPPGCKPARELKRSSSFDQGRRKLGKWRCYIFLFLSLKILEGLYSY